MQFSSFFGPLGLVLNVACYLDKSRSISKGEANVMQKLENSYLSLPEVFYERVLPAKVPDPRLLAFNHALAEEIGLDLSGLSEEGLAHLFSGQEFFEDSPTIALAYAGYQFGHAVPQLGDGRAHLLGESSGFDIQLKGSGQTAYSRNGDGKSALGPVIREYIMSEAMHRLGVPTTRALAAVRTGEEVYRQDGPEPAGIFTRVAASHIRVGTFQYFAFKRDLDSIVALLDYTIGRHYPELNSLPNDKKAMALLQALTQKQIELVAMWSGLGFIHGVMNTDNFSLAGITIDYGPCAFMEEFKFERVFSSIDENGRYSFFNQVPIAKWNILRLADCLLPLIDSEQEKAIKKVEEELVPLFPGFDKARIKSFARKLGLVDYEMGDEKLVMQFLEYLENHSLDFTHAFRYLPDLFEGDDFFYRAGRPLQNFVDKWKARIDSAERLIQINPLYIPRNHLVQKAINECYSGSDTFFFELNNVLSNPFEIQAGAEEFAMTPNPHERVFRTFCGT